MVDVEFDVFVQGTVFSDLVLTGLPTLPTRGTEVYAEGMGTSPGGTANLAIAASLLGCAPASPRPSATTCTGSSCGGRSRSKRVWTCRGPAALLTGTRP